MTNLDKIFCDFQMTAYPVIANLYIYMSKPYTRKSITLEKKSSYNKYKASGLQNYKQKIQHRR